MTAAMVERQDLRELVRMGRFEPNEETIAAMEDIVAGRGLIGPFASAREMMAAVLIGDGEETRGEQR